MKISMRGVKDIAWWVWIFDVGYRFGQPEGADIPLWLWLTFIPAVLVLIFLSIPTKEPKTDV